MLYVHYVEFARYQPFDVRDALGRTTGRDPGMLSHTAAKANPNKRKRTTEFNRSLAEEDDEDEPSQESVDSGVASDATCRTAAAASTTGASRATVARTSAVSKAVSSRADLIRLLSGTAGALEFFLEEEEKSDIGARRTATADVTVPPTSGGRYNKQAFTPTIDQIRAHNAITNQDYRGESPPDYAMRLTSSSEFAFAQHPGIATRLYDFGFGRGLSIMHFTSVGLASRYLTDPNDVNMYDFSAKATPPTATAPANWTVVLNAASNFAKYCAGSCNAATYALSATVHGFLDALQSWGTWPDEDLPILVNWINRKLGEYRWLVAMDERDGTHRHAGAMAWFDKHSSELQTLRSLNTRKDIMGLKSDRGHGRGQQGGASGQPKQPTRPAGKGKPATRVLPV